jgi:integrase
VIEPVRLWLPESVDEGTAARINSELPLFGEYARRWLHSRVELRVTTWQHYESVLRVHLIPRFGPVPLDRITPAMIRDFWTAKHGVKASTATDSYRILRMVYARAIEEGLLQESPCKIKAGGTLHSPERPTVTPEEVVKLSYELPRNVRIVPYLAAYCQLRRGEILGLERQDIDTEKLLLHVRQSAVHLKSGKRHISEPKTKASRRTISIPPHLAPMIEAHLDRFVAERADSTVIVGRRNKEPLGGSTWDYLWHIARQEIGRPEIHLHDLRHSGATWAAGLGVPLRDLMARLGHSTPAMAIHYQHASTAHDQAVAEKLSALAGWQPGDSP